MVVIARLDWIQTQLAAGHNITVHFTWNPITETDKVKFLVHPGQRDSVHSSLIDMALSSVRSVVASAVTVDRGHKHSSCISEVCFWIRRRSCASHPDVEQLVTKSPILPEQTHSENDTMDAFDTLEDQMVDLEANMRDLMQTFVEERFNDHVTPQAYKYLTDTMTPDMVNYVRQFPAVRSQVLTLLSGQLLTTLLDRIAGPDNPIHPGFYAVNIEEYCRAVVERESPLLLDHVLQTVSDEMT